jgi:heme exporter protein B
LSKVFAIVWKDILSELRTREIAVSVLVFAILIIVIFNFAKDAIGLVAPGILWVAFTFAGVLSLNRTFAMEREKGCLEGLMLCPVSRDTLYWGKMIASFVLMLVIEIIVTPIFLVLYDLPLFVPELILITALATLGFVSVGTLFSALTVNIRARDIMLPILFFPIVIPVIIAAVEATQVALDGKPFGDMASWLQIMGAFDAIFLVISAFTFEFVIEE